MAKLILDARLLRFVPKLGSNEMVPETKEEGQVTLSGQKVLLIEAGMPRCASPVAKRRRSVTSKAVYALRCRDALN